MKIKSAELECLCGITSKLPANSLPEIAFSGKSNVGKSSLINSLLGRKSLARTSSEPGKTQTINFYNINNAFYFVDLPGYGYAKTSKKLREAWGKMINNYLCTSKTLCTIFLLVDIRHEAKEHDKQMLAWIKESGFRPVIIGTKADKLKKNALIKQIKILKEGFGLSGEDTFIPFSSVTKSGCEEVWRVISEALNL